MTVNGLWSVLESSKCGKRVGAAELQSKTLAIDLSIWICEGLKSSTLVKYHESPALYLVFSRVIALLKLGVTPVVCVEGKKRTGGAAVSPMQRRPHEFSVACEECAKVLAYTGCQVIHAEYEAEALCALLSMKGLVDGVITNDGDALVYGANCIYTNFTLEGLNRSTIMRYDDADLRVIFPSSNEKDDDSNDVASIPQSSTLTLAMSREDLVAFALLTGSDLAGEGVPHVGAKKALQFLHGCKKSMIPECPLKIIRYWREQRNNDEEDALESQRKCTICLHPGDCRQHKAKGCAFCGTSKNQQCIPVSEEEKFRRKLCEKTKMLKSFAGQKVIDAYLQKDVQRVYTIRLPSRPRLDELNRCKIIISGRSQESNQSNLVKVVCRLLARFDLMYSARDNSPAMETKVVAQRITKALVHKGYPCYEIQWFVPDFEYYFSSFEWQTLVEASLSDLLEEFKKRERQIFQRKNDDNRIVMFTGVGALGKQREKKASRKRPRVFGKKLTTNTMNVPIQEKGSRKQGRKSKRAVSMDISMLLQSVDIGNRKKDKNHRKDWDDDDNSTLSSKSKSETLQNHDDEIKFEYAGLSSAFENIINNNDSPNYSPLPSTFTVYESPESSEMFQQKRNQIHQNSTTMPTLGRHGIDVTVNLGIPVKLSPIVVRYRSIFDDRRTFVN